MKKTVSLLLALTLALFALTSLASCSGKGFEIAVPNDTTNEARALLLLEAQGIIKLKEGVGMTATVRDIVDNPYNVSIKEVEAAQIPNILKDVDYAVINSNYAIDSGLKPETDALAIEDKASEACLRYANILAVKSGNENSPKILALKAALESQAVADYIQKTYAGSVISTVETPGDGYDANVDYDALKGTTIKVGATPNPHAEILKNVVKGILEAKGITLEITEFTDYVIPNNAVESGEIDANYFQHLPYLESFNNEKNTHIVSVASIHVEPMGLYGGKQSSLDSLKNSK